MRAGLIAYIVGLTLTSLAPRPEISAGAVVAVIALSLFWVAGKSRTLRRKVALLAAAALLGFAWHLVWAGMRLDAQLAPELEGRDMLVGGIVRGLPRRFDEIQQFTFEIRQHSESGFENRRVLLNHYGEEEILAGKAYRFEVRMNRPRGSGQSRRIRLRSLALPARHSRTRLCTRLNRGSARTRHRMAGFTTSLNQVGNPPTGAGPGNCRNHRRPGVRRRQRPDRRPMGTIPPNRHKPPVRNLRPPHRPHLPARLRPDPVHRQSASQH